MPPYLAKEISDEAYLKKFQTLMWESIRINSIPEKTDSWVCGIKHDLPQKK